MHIMHCLGAVFYFANEYFVQQKELFTTGGQSREEIITATGKPLSVCAMAKWEKVGPFAVQPTGASQRKWPVAKPLSTLKV